MTNLLIHMAQLNPVVGAVEANCAAIAEVYAAGIAARADLVLTPELSVTGYPLEDLVLKPGFLSIVAQAVESLAELTKDPEDPGLIVGFPHVAEGVLYNAVGLLEGGRLTEVRYKAQLPNYGVFDEKRVFTASSEHAPIPFRDRKLGVMICEDMWFEGPAAALKGAGAEILLVPTCSPFERGKMDQRRRHAKNRVLETGLPLVFCNQIGGQDDLVFDGASFVVATSGDCIISLPPWEEAERLVEVSLGDDARDRLSEAGLRQDQSLEEQLYQAAVLGLRDYVSKNGFPGVVLGLSGGIDSALTAAMAVDALGAEKVHCVMMPSDYTSSESLQDAEDCAVALGVRYDIIAIKDAVQAYDRMLAPVFEGREADITEENIQSRARGLLLMALSNKFGSMVLTTGNKSEVAVGYATLYGDMCGGYNPLKDIYKMQVFALSRWRNSHVPKRGLGPAGSVIPDRIITKPPTAELRPDQKDEDSLPPYERLDQILDGLIEKNLAAKDLVEQGFDADEVARIERLLYIAEYKRRQAAPGAKVSTMSFGRDRRYPITNGFRSARYL